MYESAEVMERELGLAPWTRQRLREMFAGRTCCVCGAPAQRLSAGEFYCHADYPRRRSGEPRPARVYKHPVGMER
jgi:hypothetical protein